jgi:hypothetical protein
MLVNTQYWTPEAKRFREEGSYCKYPEGSSSWRDYWMEQTQLCKGGYSVGGIRIPGPYYFYLNFNQILLIDETSERKHLGFPRVTDVDLEFFNYVEKARSMHKGLILLKPRRIGFSYKVSRLGLYEYNFFRNSKTIIAAHSRMYSSNTMRMLLQGINFLEKNTPWIHPRNPDTQDYIISRHKKVVGGVEAWYGYHSEVQALTFKDNPFASVGLHSSLFLFEEAAADFPNIIQSYNISEPCWKDGDTVVGLAIVFGSAGDMDHSTQSFEKMFYEPDKYNLLAMNNIWEENKKNTTCGWFIPACRMRFGPYNDVSKKFPGRSGEDMVDKNGNSQEDLATQSVLDFYRTKEKSGDNRALNDAKSQYPLVISDAFLRRKGSPFPIQDLQARLAKVETDRILLNTSYISDLVVDESGTVILTPSNKHPIREFPLSPDADMTGAVEIFDKPVRDDMGRIPYGMYIAGTDPVDDDDNRDVESSLQSTFVMNNYTGRIVAEYTGRTQDVKKYYENVRRLLLYYNAVCNYENNKKGLFGYFDYKNSIHLLCDIPQILRDTELVKTIGIGNKSKGTPVNIEVKKYGTRLINSWLMEHATGREDEVTNTQMLRSVGLIRELIAYDDEINTDRVDALKMLLILREDLRKMTESRLVHVKTFADDAFWERGRNLQYKMRENIKKDVTITTAW